MRERVGSIEVGKFADLIAIDLTALHLTPIHNILALLFFAVDKADVIDVWVAGERVVKDRALTKVDAAALRIDVQRAVASL
jgi:5-methylthioadenosine/S-adenosylhomocysteine deaminase